MRSFMLTLASLTAFSGSAFAGLTETHTCKNGDAERRVELKFTGDNQQAPCQVNYYKDQAAPEAVQTLWTAQADGSFCVQKRDGFVEKLSGMGWKCAGQAAAGTVSGDAPAPQADAPAQAEPEAQPASPKTEVETTTTQPAP